MYFARESDVANGESAVANGESAVENGENIVANGESVIATTDVSPRIGGIMSHKIYSIENKTDYLMEVTFFDGEIRELNLKLLIETYPEYRECVADMLGRINEIAIAKSRNGVILPGGVNVDNETVYWNAYSVRTGSVSDPLISFADALIDARELKGISQRELEEKSGVRQAEISKIERGEGNPSLKTMGKLFRAVGRELDFGNLDENVRKSDNNTHGSMSAAGSAVELLNLHKKQGEYTVKDMELLPDGVWAELINGIIYDMCVPSLPHQLAVKAITKIFDDFIEENNGVCMTFNGQTGLWFEEDETNLLVPDMMVVCDRDKLKYKGIIGAPDFVLEVLSAATRVRDLGIKSKLYKEKGVKEYWIIDLGRKSIIVNDFAGGGMQKIYGLTDRVPVLMYEGRLVVDMAKALQKIKYIESPGDVS